MSYRLKEGVPETSVCRVNFVAAKSHLRLFTVTITNTVRIIYSYVHFLFIFVAIDYPTRIQQVYI